MPIYEYRCAKCGEVQEVLQKVNDPAPETCPKCGATQSLERLVSRTSFQLKGGGWYADLYGSPKKESQTSTPIAPATSSASSATTTPAAKPAAAPSSTTAAPASSGGSSTSGSSTK